MLSNKISKKLSSVKPLNFWLPVLFLFFVFFYSCSDKKEKTAPVKDYNNPETAMQAAADIIRDSVSFVFKGTFDTDSTIELAAGTEISGKEKWGIRFYLLRQTDDTLQKVYESPLLNGSFKESTTKKIKFPSFNYELIYYNSSDYFLGSGGGEVFSYIVDFNKRNIYYAHLIQNRGISLFLSENIDNPNIKGFFLGLFRKDYPGLKLIRKDVDLSN